MIAVRLSAAAKSDIPSLLAPTITSFGRVARRRYEALLITASRDVATHPLLPGSLARLELGEAVRSHYLRYGRQRMIRISEDTIHRPRHLVVYRNPSQTYKQR